MHQGTTSPIPKTKILLTGASGFVGGHLIAALRDSYDLHAISQSSRGIEGIEQVYTWEKISVISGPFDAVIHMAGLAHDTQNKREEADYFAVNVGLTEKLLERLNKWNTNTFVYLSSVKAVVDSTSSNVLTEESTSIAQNVYGRSKLEAEQLILASNEVQSMVVLRPVLIYGKGQKGNLNTLHKLIDKGVWFPFKNWVNSRSVLSINNLTSAVQSILKSSIPIGVYFISDDKPVSTVGLLRLIGKGIGKNVSFIGIPNGIIRMMIAVLPKKLKQFTDKILGSLEVDNSKLKSALNIKEMPFRTEDDLPLAFNRPESEN